MVMMVRIHPTSHGGVPDPTSHGREGWCFFGVGGGAGAASGPEAWALGVSYCSGGHALIRIVLARSWLARPSSRLPSGAEDCDGGEDTVRDGNRGSCGPGHIGFGPRISMLGGDLDMAQIHPRMQLVAAKMCHTCASVAK